MKCASTVFLRIGAISSIVLTVLFALLTGAFFAFGLGFSDIIKQAIESGDIVTDVENVELAVQVVQSLFVALGIVFAIFTLLYLANAILGMRAVRHPSRGLLITVIVIGFGSGMELTAVGAILGLIAFKRGLNKPVVKAKKAKKEKK